jgi:hypothetical protein
MPSRSGRQARAVRRIAQIASTPTTPVGVFCRAANTSVDLRIASTRDRRLPIPIPTRHLRSHVRKGRHRPARYFAVTAIRRVRIVTELAEKNQSDTWAKFDGGRSRSGQGRERIIRESPLDRRVPCEYTPSYLLPVPGMPSRDHILNSPGLQVI